MGFSHHGDIIKTVVFESLMFRTTMWRLCFLFLVLVSWWSGIRGDTVVTHRGKTIADTAVTHTKFHTRQCKLFQDNKLIRRR